MDKLSQLLTRYECRRVQPYTRCINLFEKDGNHASLNYVRFHGFDFGDVSNEFRTKLEYSAIFLVGDLTSMCNIFELSYADVKEELQ